MHNFTQSLKVILLAIVLSFGISYVFAWTAPTVAPTGGNSTAPLNTGSVMQNKAGTLVIERTDNVVPGIESFGTAAFATVNGGVGIGTANPLGIFHIKGPAPDVFIESTTTRGPDLFFNGSGTFDGKEYILYSSGSGNTVGAGKFVIHDETAGLARLVIDTAGNVGIGTTAPTSKLHIKGSPLVGEMGFADTLGNLWFDGGTDGWATITNKSTVPSARTSFLNNSSTENVTILNSGNVGIGTTLPQSKLDVDGDLRVGGSKICYYGCYTSGGQVLCDKKRFDTGAIVQTGVYMGFTSSITPNVGEGKLVTCNY